MVMVLPKSDRRDRRERSHLALGRRIAELRQLRGLTQEEMARQAHISIGYPTLIEQGHNRPDEAILRKLAEVLRADYVTFANCPRTTATGVGAGNGTHGGGD